MTTNNIQKRFSSLASCLQLQWQIQGLGREGKGDLKFDSGDKFLSCFYLRALTCQELIYFKMSEFRTPPIQQLYKSCCQQNFDFRQIVKILTGLVRGGGGCVPSPEPATEPEYVSISSTVIVFLVKTTPLLQNDTKLHILT